jgi:hypothetical protein
LGTAEGCDDAIVAGDLAFEIELAGDEADGGMKR